MSKRAGLKPALHGAGSAGGNSIAQQLVGSASSALHAAGAQGVKIGNALS